MILIESLIVALSTYSRLPMPSFEWNEKNMKYAICFFPVVGIICGGLMFLWAKIGTALNVSDLFTVLILVCIPILVTGGIHMDGFMDTIDALSSHQPKDKKLEILSDPHCGAFACIYCCIYLIFNVAILYEIYSLGNILLICPIYVLSRSASGLCAVNLINARKSGMLSSYTKNTNRKVVNTVMCFIAALCIGGMLHIALVPCIIAVTAGALWVVVYLHMVKKHFGGVTGDTAGFFLQMFEICCMTGALIGALL